ncbi:S8 family peptidase [Desulfobacterales bacterium HSG16]|nr:S8 family peptidase [Desulfobacterales bacterium HSG16]
MPELPLLFFPTPEAASRSSLGGGRGDVHLPSHQRQGKRLSPIFDRLQKAFNARRVEIMQNMAGIDSEQVLVIETVGSVDNFANAVKRIDGLEWMGELEIDEIVPDQDFYDEKKMDKELSGRFYLVMTNQRALDEMLSLWRRYQADSGMQFERGLTKFRDIFLHLKDIRRWDIQDRLFETGLIDIWVETLEYDRDRIVRFEAELWFRENEKIRESSAGQVMALVQQSGGRVLGQSIIEGIAYHGLLAELPANAIRSIVENPGTELVKCESIMFFRPVGQVVTGDKPQEGKVEISDFEDMPSPGGHPVIALLDGLPLANHRLLAGRIQIDDPDDWETDYAAIERRHGTSMASLIVHGDLDGGTIPLASPIYIRPIMKPIPWSSTPRPEGIPENCLAVDLIHRSVKRIFEGDQGEKPVAPQVKIINLSVGDRSRQFTHSMSPMARLIDWLSVKYGVLFIVSAGNHPTSISIGCSQDDFEILQPGELEAETVKAIYKDARYRRLLSPAESINGLTVGAVHCDASEVGILGARLDPFERVLPSPVSSFGGGYRRAVKPDVMFNGGKQLYRLSLRPTEQVTIEPVISLSSPGNKVASPSSLAGERNATSYCCGTSNATALISRAAGICYDSLQQIFSEQAYAADHTLFEVPLLKALLVHGCCWGDIGNRISDVLRNPENSSQLQSLVSRWTGYGVPRLDRVQTCTDQRATLLGFGQLSDGNAHIFRLPLPPALGSSREWRRLTVTLAWLSPIAANTQKYRISSLWFEVSGVSLATNRKEGCGGTTGWRAVRRGTVQHEIFEGQKAEPFMDGEVIEIKVNCRKDAGKIQNPIAYGLAVSLEVSEGVDIAVYNEIRTRIVPAIRIQQMAETI